MPFKKLFHQPELRPDQLNADNQITDRRILSRDRVKFGVGCIMYQSEESGLTPIHTMMVRLLGGGNLHLGVVAGASTVGSLVQWIGAVLLKRFGSNRVAMNVALSGGVLFGLVMAGSLLLVEAAPTWMTVALWIYLVGAYGLAGASGVQMNVESSWIGDLVPLNMRGWFTSVKWIIGSLGVLTFTILFGQIAGMTVHPGVLSLMFVLVAVSHAVAMVLMSTVTDRKPQFSGAKAADGQKKSWLRELNLHSLPLWCYIWFYLTWAGGRTALLAFSTAYMIDYFGMGMGKITLLIAIQAVVNLVMLLVVGRASDRFGTRLPLMIISGFIGLSMMLWVGSAWGGIPLLIAYQVINGAAGNTHSMIGINYGLEIFPSQGRAAYIGFSRVFIGVSALLASLMAGGIMELLSGWKMTLWGAQLNHYHLFFFGCSLFTMSCVIPLLIAGKRKVENR